MSFSKCSELICPGEPIAVKETSIMLPVRLVEPENASAILAIPGSLKLDSRTPSIPLAVAAETGVTTLGS